MGELTDEETRYMRGLADSVSDVIEKHLKVADPECYYILVLAKPIRDQMNVVAASNQTNVSEGGILLVNLGWNMVQNPEGAIRSRKGKQSS